MGDIDYQTMTVLLDISRNLAMQSMDTQALKCLRTIADIMALDAGSSETAIATLSAIPGISMMVKPGDFISNTLIKTGIWEPEVTKTLSSIPESLGGVLVDVGANIGYFSLLWAGLNPNNRVFSIEPASRNISFLTTNINLNGFGDRITLMPVAAGNRRGISSFDIGSTTETGHGGFLASGSVVDGSTKVTTIMLDDYFDAIDVLKIDVEGADALVLMGANNLLMEKKISTILYEVNEHRCHLLGIPPEAASNFLRAHGYHVSLLVDYGPGGSEWMARIEP